TLEGPEELPHVVLDGEREADSLDRDPKLGLARRRDLVWRRCARRHDWMLDQRRIDRLRPDVNPALPGAPAPHAHRTGTDMEQPLEDVAPTTDYAVAAAAAWQPVWPARHHALLDHR